MHQHWKRARLQLVEDVDSILLPVDDIQSHRQGQAGVDVVEAPAAPLAALAALEVMSSSTKTVIMAPT